jgi:hypothetical protein
MKSARFQSKNAAQENGQMQLTSSRGHQETAWLGNSSRNAPVVVCE